MVKMDCPSSLKQVTVKFLCQRVIKRYKANHRSQKPFFLPLIEELQDLMINGLDVDYQWEEPILAKYNIKKGPSKIRVLVFNQAGDYIECRLCVRSR